ncbi:hypothetical protein, partial [Nonomuraea bangladeshensis]|uniref:hypothetical protein n=1 Tax=Nonomuraea bangladeshensis TaxID=404385 RepID=UPI003C2BC98F
MADIVIDASRLTYKMFAITGHGAPLVDGSSAVTVSLAPGTYGIEQVPGRPATFQFQVTPDGFVEYSEAHDLLLGGRGTSTLTLLGFTIVIDGTALSH